MPWCTDCGNSNKDEDSFEDTRILSCLIFKNQILLAESTNIRYNAKIHHHRIRFETGATEQL